MTFMSPKVFQNELAIARLEGKLQALDELKVLVASNEHLHWFSAALELKESYMKELLKLKGPF